jgi:hypothetical protein
MHDIRPVSGASVRHGKETAGSPRGAFPRRTLWGSVAAGAVRGGIAQTASAPLR